MPAKAGIQFLAKALGPRFRGDEREYAVSSSRAHASVDVLLVAALLLELRHERDRLLDGARAMLRHDVDQRALDILRHALGIAADIDMRAVGEPGPEVAADLAHAVLHEEFLAPVARPGEREAREHALRLHAGELVLVEEIVGRAL